MAAVREGDTCLHYAVMSRSIAVVRLLLQNDADVTALNNQQLTPIDLARKYNFSDLLPLLEGQNTSPFPFLSPSLFLLP